MNKLYKVLDIYAAWLVEVDTKHNSLSGIKNIIGIKIIHNGEHLFYSILDDCFFRTLPKDNSNKETIANQLFVQIYKLKPTFGMELYRYINKEYITKTELLEIKKNKKYLFGYQSDFSYKSLKIETFVDYENPLTIEENIIDTVQQYEEKLERPISYDYDLIYGPHHYKKALIKQKN